MDVQTLNMQSLILLNNEMSVLILKGKMVLQNLLWNFGNLSVEHVEV